MIIQVIGSGCPTCKKLFELTKEAVTQLQIDSEVEYSTDISKIVKMGVLSSPVLAIDGKPVLVGKVPDVETLKSLIASESCCDGQSACSNCKAKACQCSCCEATCCDGESAKAHCDCDDNCCKGTC